MKTYFFIDFMMKSPLVEKKTAKNPLELLHFITINILCNYKLKLYHRGSHNYRN